MTVVISVDVRHVGAGDMTDEVTAAVEETYLASFVEQERMPFEEVRTSVMSGRRRLLVAPRGFALLISLGGPDGVMLLEYLAVAPEARSRGVGAALLKAVAAGQAAPVVWEIHEPYDSADPDDLRRLRFYERNGAALIPCAQGYAMPRLGGAGVTAMRLMVLPAARAEEMRGDALRDLVTRIWAASYGRPADDAELRLVLARLAC